MMKILKMKNYNSILIEKPQKYQPYHRIILINTNILWAKKYYLPVRVENYKNSPLKKSFEKEAKTIDDQGDKQIEAVEKQGEEQFARPNDVDLYVIYANKKDNLSFFKTK